MRFALAFLLCLLPLTPARAEPLDYAAFARIPVLHEGRIKPLDSFARVMLKHIGGTVAVSPDAWLAGVLFTPAKAMDERVFVLRSTALVRALALPAAADGAYDFRDLAQAIAAHQAEYAALAAKDKKNLTSGEQELVELYNRVNEYADLLGSFSLLLPLKGLDPKTGEDFGLSGEEPSYLTFQKMREAIEKKEQAILRQKKDRIDTYTPAELRNAQLSARLTLLEAMDRNNALLRVIPSFWQGSGEWLAPWAVIVKGEGSPQSAALFKEWRLLAQAYRDGDAEAWRRTSEALLAVSESSHDVRPWALTLEALYNTLGLLNLCAFLYALGVGLAAAGMLLRAPRALGAAYVTLATGASLHAAALLMRMAILMRPPVSTLYESMIFVSLVILGFGLWLERRRKQGDVLLVTALASGALLLVSGVFGAGDDTLEVLVPVLNTNFWLATHVVCITTGYGTSLMAGAFAHLYLFRRAMGTKEQALAALEQRMYMVALLALLFTSVGTMLGGIWADQSWGRFWGWDPKENGALLIVLWLIWLLHGRVAKQLNPFAFAIGLALVNVVVALAWVGVNLLSVGLHSYGFTDLAANGLIAFCLFELSFIGITAGIARLRVFV